MEGRRGGSAVRLFAVLGALLGWCALLIAFRLYLSGTTTFRFLAWNLFLAAVPLAASTALVAAHERAAGRLFRYTCSAAWILFLPNAPYLLTDLLHLAPMPPVPLWYDLALLLSCAGTGLLLGFLSLAQVQRLVEGRHGAAAGWAVALGALLLSGYGIYLGRYQRWNSWDVLLEPSGVFGTVAGHLLDPGAHPRTVGVTLVYGGGLALAYLALRAVAAHSDAILPRGRGGVSA